jgi:hypothetical protein
MKPTPRLITERPRRKSPAGVATNDLIFTAAQGSNDELFPQILSLYVAPRSKVADVTYGRGIFWKRIPADRYALLPSDLQTGTDCRSLPYGHGSIDCVVFDPPYMHTPGGTAHMNHQNYERYYANNRASASPRKYHEVVLDLYFVAAEEARRVLRREGIYIVKCADEETDLSSKTCSSSCVKRRGGRGRESENELACIPARNRIKYR